MVRTVKTKPVRNLAKGQHAILLPGPTGAEPWEVWVFGGKGLPEVVQVCSSPLDNKLRKSTTLALPVAQVYCLPLWLNETDARQFRGMIDLQVELRGLKPRGNGQAIFDWSVVAEDSARTLVSVGVLPGSLSPELHAEAYESFDLSARYFRFPENALTIWREQDRLALAITRGPHLVYYQALAEGQITSRVLQDLNCVRTALEMQGILTPLQKVTLWTEVTPEELIALKGAFPLPIEQSECPPPVSPGQPWKLTPASVGEAQRARESQRWLRRSLYIFLVFYLLAVGWLVTHFVLTSLETKKLRKWQTDNAAAVQAVQDGQTTWKELGPVVDTNRYPLELLFHASSSLPADLHLTLFEASYQHILIKGEAKNVAGAFQFLSKLKADPFFTGYTLDMSNPRPLPNDLAQFQIEGNRATQN
jgi:hypothetical protein